MARREIGEGPPSVMCSGFVGALKNYQNCTSACISMAMG
jgi:hypothetical protein